MRSRVISHECEDDIVYRCCCRQIDYGTMIYVGWNQKAVLVRAGMPADVLNEGKNVIEPQNIPLMMKILNSMSEDYLPFFSAQVYFFNMSRITGLTFGTSLEIMEFLDRELVPEGCGGVVLQVGLRGRYSIQIRDPRLFLKKLIADQVVIERRFIECYFDQLLLAPVKSELKRIIRRDRISIFDLEEHLEDFSARVWKKVREYFQEIGLDLVCFQIVGMDAQDDENYRKVCDLYYREAEALSRAVTEARVDRIHGTTYNDRQFQKILMELAKNPSGNSYVSAGMEAAAAKWAYDWTSRRFSDQYSGESDGMEDMGNMRSMGNMGSMENMGGMRNTRSGFLRQVCPRCRTLNPAEARYCMFCSCMLSKKGRGYV